MQTPNHKSQIVNHKSGPRPGSIGAQLAAHRDTQAALALDITVRSEAARLGADKHTIEDLVLEARRVFPIANAVPVARAHNGDLLLGANGFPITPEEWLQRRLAAQS